MVDIAGHRTLHGLLAEQAELRSGSPFLTVEDRAGACVTLTYDDFTVDVRRLAGGFQDMGIGRGDAVMLHLPNCAEFVRAWFALGTLGAVVVPAHTAHTGRELRYAATRAGVRAVITGVGSADEVREALTGVVAVDRVITTGDRSELGPTFAELLGHPEIGSTPEVGSSDPLQVVFTSGTTADPKGVVLTHANAVRSGLQIAHSLYLTPQDVCLTSLPVFHVNAQSSTVLASLAAGAHAVLLEAFSASGYVDRLIAHEATITSLVATQVRTLLRQPPSPRDAAHQVRAVFYAINVTDDEFAAFEERFGMRLLNGYGLSEAYTAVTIAPLCGERRWPSIGRPLLDREVAILDSSGSPVPPGTVGEIAVRGVPGRGIFAGYLDDAEATSAALRGEWLHTGDFGRADEDGFLYFVDRKKDMIKRSGENVSAGEIERVMLDHPQVTEAAVIGVPDDIRDEAIVAFVAVSDPAVSAEDLLEHCAANLARFKVPTTVSIHDELPKTSIGKIEKKVLRSWAAR